MGVFENAAIFFVSDNGASAEQIIRGDLHDRTAPPGSAKTYLSIGPAWSSLANTPYLVRLGVAPSVKADRSVRAPTVRGRAPESGA